MIYNCDCDNKFQDLCYGKGMRVFNIRGSGEKARCTICGKEVIITKKEKEAEKKERKKK